MNHNIQNAPQNTCMLTKLKPGLHTTIWKAKVDKKSIF